MTESQNLCHHFETLYKGSEHLEIHAVLIKLVEE